MRLNILPPAEHFRSKQVKLEDIAEEVRKRSKQCHCKRAQTCQSNL